MTDATLHLLCGKIAAGKSTLARRLGESPATIVLSEDRWLARLYAGELTSMNDYLERADRLRETIAPHVVELLWAGVSVVLDFHANTLSSRAWMRDIIDRSGARHELHFLDSPDDICRARLRARNAAGAHDFAVSDEQFDLITSYFVAPTDDEGFNVVTHC
ncbi:MAG: AAA family ATPase [Rhizobiaceae bacterium]